MPDAQAIQAHLGILSGVIARMAANSGAAKTWCITLVSAILVVLVDNEKTGVVWLVAVPSFLFLILDAYYLGLERGFRARYADFVKKLHNGFVADDDLYTIAPLGSLPRHVLSTLLSFSIWPFYVGLLLIVYLANRFIIVP